MEGKLMRDFSAFEETVELLKASRPEALIRHEARRWLSDLLQDAQHGLAPQELKAKAAAVRQYLGDDPNGVTPQQLTRFTSDFERYVEENTAPNKAAAIIFAEFKEWLATIYKNTKGSNIISPEIRKWFEQSFLTHVPTSTVAADGPSKEVGTERRSDASRQSSGPQPERPNVDRMLNEAIATDLKTLWGGRLPTWAEFKEANQADRVKVNKGVAQRALNHDGVPLHYRITFGIITQWAMFVVPVVSVVAYLLGYSKGWVVLGALAVGVYMYKVTFTGACYGVREGAAQNEALYQNLVFNGAFLFGPPDRP
jgi:hypothetical protein